MRIDPDGTRHMRFKAHAHRWARRPSLCMWVCNDPDCDMELTYRQIERLHGGGAYGAADLDGVVALLRVPHHE